MPESPLNTHERVRRHQSLEKGWDCAVWLLIVLLAFLFGCGVMKFFVRMQETAHRPLVLNNGRQIMVALKTYATDHNGKYPNGGTANEAFRELVKAGLLKDEGIFGGLTPLYIPDGNLGTPPDFKEAVGPGENHWAMTKGLDLKSDGATPLVFENPITPTWPPRWDSLHPNQSKEGRMWKDWVIIVGRNDGSVAVEKLVKDSFPTTTLKPIKDGKNLFDLAGPHKILDVEK